MIEYPSTKSGLLRRDVKEMIGEAPVEERIKAVLEERIKAVLEEALTEGDPEQLAKKNREFKFLMDSPFVGIDQGNFSDLMNKISLNRENEGVNKQLKNEIFSRWLNIKDAENISTAKEFSIIFGALLVNSFVRYYNLYMVNAVTFVFLSSAIQLLSFAASLVIGYQVTTMLSGWINHHCFAREKEDVKFSSIVGSLHFENYFICAFGKSFYDSLKVTKYNFEDKYADGILVFSDFKDVIAARKSIFYKYSCYQKHIASSGFIQSRVVHNKVSANMAQEFASIKLPESINGHRILESKGAEDIWSAVSKAVLTRQNFNHLLNECIKNNENKKFICALYDACMQYNAELGLEELYVLSELINQCLFPGYVSHLDLSARAVVVEDGQEEIYREVVREVEQNVAVKKLDILAKKEGVSMGRLIFSLEYLQKSQENFANASVERIRNAKNSLLLVEDSSPYSTEMDLNAMYKRFEDLDKAFHRAYNSKEVVGSKNDNLKDVGSNVNGDSFQQLIINALKNFFTSESTKKHGTENKITFMKSASTCVSGVIIYGLSNTFIINFALSGMSLYLVYEGVGIVVGRKYIDDLALSVMRSIMGSEETRSAS